MKRKVKELTKQWSEFADYPAKAPLQKHCKSVKLPWHHDIKLSFWSLSFCLFAFLPNVCLFVCPPTSRKPPILRLQSSLTHTLVLFIFLYLIRYKSEFCIVERCLVKRSLEPCTATHRTPDIAQKVVFFFTFFIEYQNVILATILGELVRMKFSLLNINCPPGWKGGELWLLLGGPDWGRNVEVWRGDGGGVGEEEDEEGEEDEGGEGGDGGGGGGKPLLRICAWKSK